MKPLRAPLKVLCVLWMAAVPGCTQAPGGTAFLVAHSDAVAAMMDGVLQSEVETYLKNLSGESTIEVGGEAVRLTTRNIMNTEMTRLATQYAHEFMEARGLAVHYEEWSDSSEGISGRNVAAEIPGTVRPDEIVLVTAHLDTLPEEGPAPGADDNARGSVGTMLAAARLAGHAFERTIRFVLFTGEEYGPTGSQAYAAKCRARNENILGVLNLDVMGWDANDDGLMFLQTRNFWAGGSYRKDAEIAGAFVEVLEAYGLDSLRCEIEGNRSTEADVQSFWDADYPAVLVIEDERYESNEHWHQPTDTVATLNLPYCTDIIRATVGTAAHMARPAS